MTSCLNFFIFYMLYLIITVTQLYILYVAKSLQSCPTLRDSTDGSPPGSPVPGTLQARTLEWVAVSFSNAWRWKVKVKSLSRVRLFKTPWMAAYQAPLPMGFSRQEYWSGVPLPSQKRYLTCFFWEYEIQRLHSILFKRKMWSNLATLNFCITRLNPIFHSH